MSITGSQSLGTDLSGHVFDVLSDAEFERRWDAVSKEMAAQGVDVLVMENTGDGVGGYTRYFTDVQAYHGYPVAAVFERDKTITLVTHGPHGGESELPPAKERPVRGATRVLTDWTFLSAPYCGGYEASRVLEALKPYEHGTVGLVGTLMMSGAFLEHVRAGLPHASFVETSNLVDDIKAVKSDEELAGIRLCAEIQEQLLEVLFETAKPGVTERDCLVAVDKRSRDLGSDQAVLAIGAGPAGTIPNGHRPRQRLDHVLERGDWLKVLVETNGPGGWYTELGRIAVLGKLDAGLEESAAIAAELQDFTMGLLQPGASCQEAFETYQARLRELGLPEENRVHCHGQGYEIVERPLVRSDETMRMAGRMNLACHPTWEVEGNGGYMCDNFVTREDGTFERLHTTQRVAFEL